MQPNPKFRVSGAVFENERDTGPAFSGFIEIDGVRTQIALWPKTSAKGQNYLQVSEDKKKTQPQGQQRQAPRSPFKQPQPVSPGRRNDDMDDDIPQF